jgi:anti-sigma factor RsiW
MNEHLKCSTLLQTISDYVDGVLDPSLCAELEEHLCDCDNCQVVLNTMKKTIEIYHTLPAGDMPDEVRTRLYKKLNLEDYIR